MKAILGGLGKRLARRRPPMGSRKAMDVVRWAMVWSALMAGLVSLFVRVWLDPAARGERRERATFLKRIWPRRPKPLPGANGETAPTGRS